MGFRSYVGEHAPLHLSDERKLNLVVVAPRLTILNNPL
jgi:hypothetical protein